MWLRRESICLQCGRPRFNPWVGKIPWRRKGQPTPVLFPGKPHGQRSLVGYSPWGCKELDTTEQLYFHFSLSLGLIHWRTWGFSNIDYWILFNHIQVQSSCFEALQQQFNCHLTTQKIAFDIDLQVCQCPASAVALLNSNTGPTMSLP